jgi:hypothetical protein
MLMRSTRLRRQPTGRPTPALAAAVMLATSAAVAAPHLAAGAHIRQAGSSGGRNAAVSAAAPITAGTGSLPDGLPWDQLLAWARPAPADGAGRCHPRWMIQAPVA